MKTNCGVYKIINIENNKVYIGSSQNLKNRKYTHFKLLKSAKHHCDHLQKSFKKYTLNDFRFIPLKLIEKISDKKLLKEELLKWENYFLKEYLRVDKSGKEIIDHDRCYNSSLKAGSCLGCAQSNESNIKRSRSLRGRVLSEETKQKISSSNKGKKMTEVVKQKMSISKKGSYPFRSLSENEKSNIYAKIGKAHRGKKLSKEHTDKIRQSKKGCIHSEETKKKMSESHKGNKYCLGRKQTSETILKKSDKIKKKVTNLDTGEIFNSLIEASKSVGLKSSSGIGEVCKGLYRTAGGYRWEYTESRQY